MDVAKLRNPYDYANPVSDPGLFAGRSEELDRLGYVLDQAGLDMPVGYVAVHGRRAAGKTSLLNMTEVLARERGYLTVRIDLVPDDSTPLPFFTKLYEEVISSAVGVADLVAPDGSPITPRIVRRIINGAARNDAFPLEFPESLAQAGAGGRLSQLALRTDLRYLLSQVKRPIVLLIDEAQLIAGHEDVLSILRTLGMQLSGFVFVLAGTADLLARVHAVFDHLLRQFTYVEVTRFIEIAEVEDCVSRPLLAAGLEPTDCFENLRSTADDLLALTDGNPYEIQFYCSAMFSRWQRGAADRLVLSPEAFDDVRQAMETGREIHQRPLITAVRAMSAESLTALNLLCSALGRASLDEVWFAHTIAGRQAMTREELNRHLDDFVAAGLIERDGTVIKLIGDLSDQIYVRLWTLKQLDVGRNPHAHAQLINSLTLPYLLSRNLEYFLCELSDDVPARVLQTCCPQMDASVLDEGIAALDALRTGEQLPHTVAYLHDAILHTGYPAALDISTVECRYADTSVTRWLCSADADDFDLATTPAFVEAARKAAGLGGELRADRVRLPLKPWPQIIEWLAENAEAGMLQELARSHSSRSDSYYESDDLANTLDQLRTSFRLAPSWKAANNLSYLCLRTDEHDEALQWADRALGLTEERTERGLSGYNAAMSLLVNGDPAEANRRLGLAAEALARPPSVAYVCSYLLIPRLQGSTVELVEQTDVDLATALHDAAELTEVAERYARLQRGPHRFSTP